MSTAMSDDVMALSGEIDAAITAMNEEEATRGDLVDEKDKEATGETEVETTDPATEEVENVEEEIASPEVGSETSEVERDDDGRTEDPEETLPPQISDDTLERAVATGIPVVDAKALTSESLERVIQAREAAFEQAARDAMPAEKPTEKEEPKDLFVDLPKLDKENYEPEVIAQIEGIKEIARRQQAELQEFRDHNEQATQSANLTAEREIEVWYDGQIKNLGDDFKESLGEGGYSTMDRNSKQFENRDAIVEQMSVIFAGYHAQNLPVPSREQVFDSAVGLVLRDTYAEIQSKKLQGDLAKQSRQHIQRAGGGKAKSELSDEDAIAAELEKRFG